MQQEAPSYPELRPRSRVLVVDGYGIAIKVNRGRLVISDGIGLERRQRALSRSSREINRIVMLGHSGYLTFEAIRWMTDVGVGFCQIDTDGRLIMTSSTLGRNDGRLRRAQALASVNGTGLELAREIISRKLEGQARVLGELGAAEGRLEALGYLDPLATAPSIDAVRHLEAQAANTYWREWSGIEVIFERRSQTSAPEHWRTFGMRGSPLAMGARLAVNPPNAILNYCYALAEVECRLALATLGLDVGLGVLHADQKARDSMALDLLEVLRPDVDSWVLALLRSRTFRAKDFNETRQGNCRVLAPLTHVLAESLFMWRRAAAPVAEEVARRFASGSSVGNVPTPLTGNNRAGRAGPRSDSGKTSARGPTVAAACKGCGESMPTRERRYCQACAAEMDQVKVFSEAGPAALARLRTVGRDPSASGAARAKVGRTNFARRRARLKWEAAHESSVAPETFTSDILPKLRRISVERLAAATGLSLIYCSRIRRGLVVPHPMHWEAFERAALG